MDSRTNKILILIISSLALTFDLICDWLFYYEVSGLEQGLVFGPFPSSVMSSLLAFSVIGTMTYITEVIVTIMDVQDKSHLPSWLLDGANVIVVWANVPLIFLNVYIAGCRKVAVSILQMVKAIAVMLEVLTIIGVIFSKKYLQNTKLAKNKRKTDTKCLLFTKTLGLTIMLTGSILVLVFTRFFIDSKNVIQFSSPDKFNHEKYIMESHLNEAGIYMNFYPNQEDVVTMETTEWIKLADLSKLTTSQSKTTVTILKFDTRPNKRFWIQTTTDIILWTNLTSTCYSTDVIPLQIGTTCSADLSHPTAATTVVVFKFVYQAGSNRVQLGDVHYNYRMYPMSSYCNTTLNTTSTPKFSINYFKVVSGVNSASPLMTLTNVTAAYYISGTTLQLITDAWRTGHFKCGPTGRPAPKLDTSIDIPCLATTDVPTTFSTTTDSPTTDSTTDSPTTDSTTDSPTTDSTTDSPTTESTTDSTTDSKNITIGDENRNSPTLPAGPT